MDELVLKYSHNVIEHLGLKLYQNRPTSVIAEIVSNCWDADARRVEVNMSMGSGDRWVAVADDGHGMDRHTLASAYLIIGHGRRSTPTDRSRGGRSLMGRKGIGKLAPFGIARFVDVATSALVDQQPLVHWLRFDLAALLGKHDDDVSYEPELIAEGVRLNEIPLARDETGQVERWRNQIGTNETGTLVLMTSLSLSKAINEDQLIGSLGSRLTVTWRQDFGVSVNGKKVEVENSLPEFEFRIPETGKTTVLVNEREVSFWVGFVKNAQWPADEAGVGVYAHGKLAQDRPFTFGVKGKEIFSRYMFAVVDAEWLDEFSKDLISTDRTSINWEAEEVQALHAWGQENVRSWVAAFEKWRRQQEENENRELVRASMRAGDAGKVTAPEEEEIVRLVSEITPAFGKNEGEKKRLVRAVSEAWVQRPMRRLVKDLWTSIGEAGDMPPGTFTQIVERLSIHSVPESLNLAVVFAQRAFALTRLYDYVHHGTETNLQKLIERFPWIIEPDLAVLTANESLKTAARKAEELGQIPQGRRTTVGGVPEANKPDFVFLSSPEERQIVVVELKNPQEDLTIDNRAQLQDYLMWIEAHYPEAEQRGYLVGRNPSNLDSPYRGLEIVPWTEVLHRSRARNIELLSAMLLRTGGDASTDTRIADALELGGADAKALLARLAEDHEELKELMDSFSLVEAKKPLSSS